MRVRDVMGKIMSANETHIRLKTEERTLPKKLIDLKGSVASTETRIKMLPDLIRKNEADIVYYGKLIEKLKKRDKMQTQINHRQAEIEKLRNKLERMPDDL